MSVLQEISKWSITRLYNSSGQSEIIFKKLQEHGFETRVDSRSHSAQNIEYQPTVHLGSTASNVPTVKKYLRSLDPAICKCATMDFAEGYANSVHAVLPDAKVVIDKFHVVQLLNNCVDAVRKEIQNELRKQTKPLMAGWKPFPSISNSKQ